MYSAVQSQKVVSAYFTSKQILPLSFVCHYIPRVPDIMCYHLSCQYNLMTQVKQDKIPVKDKNSFIICVRGPTLFCNQVISNCED